MRPLMVLVLFALVTSAGHAITNPSPAHSPNVLEASHEPGSPGRGEPVLLTLRLANDTQASTITAIYCRVESYACAPALGMARTGPDSYAATIPWTPSFFKRAVQIGYRFHITYADGRTEESPVADWPATPEHLPATGDSYYFYRLPDPSPIPGMGLAWAAAALAGSILVVRTRTR